MTSPVKTYPLHAAFEDDALRIGELDDYAALLAQHEVAMAELNDANMALELLHEDYVALLKRVADAPVVMMGERGVLYGQWSKIEALAGRRVRILAEPGEVDRG